MMDLENTVIPSDALRWTIFEIMSTSECEYEYPASTKSTHFCAKHKVFLIDHEYYKEQILIFFSERGFLDLSWGLRISLGMAYYKWN